MGKLNFKRVKGSDKLADQFGMSQELFESSGERWKRCFDAIDELIAKQVKASFEKEEDGFEFDATEAFDIFFNEFTTEELQQLALVQLLMNDVNRRAERTVKRGLRDHFGGMLREMAKAALGENQEEDAGDDKFDEDLL